MKQRNNESDKENKKADIIEKERIMNKEKTKKERLPEQKERVREKKNPVKI